MESDIFSSTCNRHIHEFIINPVVMKSIIVLAAFVMSLNGLAQQYGSFTDSRDGKVYKTVKIGSQVWMAENLSFVLSSGSCTINDTEDPCFRGHRYYLWESAVKACPNGWRLPSDTDWQRLIDYAGESAFEDLTSGTCWQTLNGARAKNVHGFSVTPTSMVKIDGIKKYYTAIFWSISQKTEQTAWQWIFGESNGIRRESDFKQGWGCVRCIKSN